SSEQSEIGMSSVVDTWLVVRELEQVGERNRIIYVLKSRGMAHSNQVREFLMTKHGIELADVFLGSTGLVTGSARLAQAAVEREAGVARHAEVGQTEQQLERKRQLMEAQIAALQSEFEAEARALLHA